MKTTQIEITAVLEVENIDGTWGGKSELIDNLPNDDDVELVTWHGGTFRFIGKLRVTRAKEVRP
jgi:hypothetical protein